MFTALTSTFAAAAIIATGAFVGASSPDPEGLARASGASQALCHGGDGGGHDPRDMARMHERMMTGDPGMAEMHERMTSKHPDMVRMHEQMMGMWAAE